MIWAKIVNDEIMQTHDENPAGLWHPDAIAKNDITGYWEEVPDHVNVGWKFKNNEWISGGQWLDEYIATMPPPPVLPPVCRVDFTAADDLQSNKFTITVDSHVGGEYNTWSITVGNTVYSVNVTSANSDTDEFTCDSTSLLHKDDPIQFMTDTVGGIEKHKTYMVHTVVDATKFKICDPMSPLQAIQLTSNSGTMLLSKGPNLDVEFTKTDSPQPIAFSITATGPGGTTTYTAENDLALIVPEIWVPLFART
jgi:hypothetical protein